MSWYKILKMQKVDVIYIYISFGDRRRTFSSPNRLKKKTKQKTIGDEMFHRLKFNRQGYKFPRVKIIW